MIRLLLLSLMAIVLSTCHPVLAQKDKLMIDYTIQEQSVILSAIEVYEGYFEHSRSFRNNNPGNIRVTSWTKGRPGYIGSDADGFAIFESKESGVQALSDLLFSNRTIYRHLTLKEAISRYAPKNENDTDAYYQFVLSRLNET